VPLHGIKVIVFDVYGTLLCSGLDALSVDARTDREPALRGAIEAVGLRLLSKEGFREKWIETVKVHQRVRRQEGIAYPEVDIRRVWGTFLETLKTAGLLEGYWDESTLSRVSIEYECRVHPAWPMPDFLLVLDVLRAAHFHLGIISNAQFFTPVLIECLGGASLEALGFDREGCVWSYRMGEAKPSVALYQQSAAYWRSHYGVEAENVLYVGNDLLNDIWPARKVGFRTALFAGDARSLQMREGDPRIDSVIPDLIITCLSQLLGALHS
jgi:putative hydrolase of the HAD superfamily